MNDISTNSTDQVRELMIPVLGWGFTAIKFMNEFAKRYEHVPGWKVILKSVQDGPMGALAGANTENFPEWTLNVPAKSMSFYEDKALANDFVDFLNNPATQRQFREKYSWYDSWAGPETAKHFTGEEFVPRAFFYKDYLSAKWQETLDVEELEKKGISIDIINGVGIDWVPLSSDSKTNSKNQRAEFTYINKNDGGKEITEVVDLIVGALGNSPAEEIIVNSGIGKRTDSRIKQEPLRDLGITVESLKAAKGEKVTVVIKGVGNTGIDLAVAVQRLAKEAGAEVEIIGVQRHNQGTVKHSKTTDKVYPPENFAGIKTIEAFWQAIETGLRQSSFAEGDIVFPDGIKKDSITIGNIHVPIGGPAKEYKPQAVIDAAKLYSKNFWEQLSTDEKTWWFEGDGKIVPDALYRFLRNRTTPETGAKLEEMIEGSGPVKLRLIKGDITEVITQGEDEPLSVSILKDVNGKPVRERIDGNHVYVLDALPPNKLLKANSFLDKLRDTLVRSHNGGLSFVFNKFIVKLADNLNAWFISLSHNVSKFLESTGVREKRGQTEEAVKEALAIVKDIIKERESIKGAYTQNLARPFGGLIQLFDHASARI